MDFLDLFAWFFFIFLSIRFQCLRLPVNSFFALVKYMQFPRASPLSSLTLTFFLRFYHAFAHFFTCSFHFCCAFSILNGLHVQRVCTGKLKVKLYMKKEIIPMKKKYICKHTLFSLTLSLCLEMVDILMLFNR